jgi:uncharacterized integral membrane protein
LSRAPRSATSTTRKIVAALILVPLAVVIIAFALANRQAVPISLDPFGSDQSSAFVTPPLPLFLWLILALILGVLIGGFASRLRHGRWRRAARRLERELDGVRAELDLHKRAAGAHPVSLPQVAAPPERLRLRVPLH